MCVSMCKNRVFRGIVPVKDSCRQRSTHNDRGQAPRLSVNTVRAHGGSDRFGWLCVQVTVLRCAELVPADWSYSKKAYVSSDPYVKLQVSLPWVLTFIWTLMRNVWEKGVLYID